MAHSLLAVPSGYESESGISSYDEDESCEMSFEKQTSEEAVKTECWYKFLKRKIGLDINARLLIEKNPELAELNKSELIVRLAYELCLAKDPLYDPENNAVENENNKYRRFDTRRIFALFKVLNDIMEKSDRRKFVEFVCQKSNVQLLEMICQEETKSKRTRVRTNQKYPWKGDFTGYEDLTELLQYVLKQPCSEEIVLCIAKKVYGTAHIFCNGEQYLDDIQVSSIRGNFDYKDSVIKDSLKAAIKFGYKDVLSVMLSGDIYHCIRLMKGKKFQEEEKFREALDMTKETVAEVLSSWVKDKRQSCKGEVRYLLTKGIEMNMEKMGKNDLLDELESLEIEVKDKKNITKKELMEKLEETVGGVKIRLRKSVVGALISALFVNYKLVRATKNGERFKLKISAQDSSRRENEINELNNKVDSKKFVEEEVLKRIKLLNLKSPLSSDWFFREVLEEIVNNEEKFRKLQAVCTAICKDPMQGLLKNETIHEEVIDVLEFVNVEILSSQITKLEIPNSLASIDDHFVKNIQKLAEQMKEEGKVEIEKETRQLKISDRLAFSGLSRNTIRELKEKRLKEKLKDEEEKVLNSAVSRAMFEVKEGINILASKTVDVGDIFKHFEIINSEIEAKTKREIVEHVCEKGNVQLLEMICQQEVKDKRTKVRVSEKYPWKGDFTGYEELIYLLQYALQQPCSEEIVLCIAKKVYGSAHILYNGTQYLDDRQVASMKGNFGYKDSVLEGCLKKAIELNYEYVVSVMLSGDVYHTIRLMKNKRFEEKIFRDALDMIKETVAEVISSWVEDESLSRSCKKEINLLDTGIEVKIEEMTKEELIDELEYRQINIKKHKKKK